MKYSMCDFADVHLIQKGIPNFNFGTVACVILQTIVVWDRQKLKNVRNKKENDVHLIQKWVPNFNFGTVRSMCDFAENCNLRTEKSKECTQQQRKWCSPDPKMKSEFQLSDNEFWNLFWF